MIPVPATLIPGHVVSSIEFTITGDLEGEVIFEEGGLRLVIESRSQFVSQNYCAYFSVDTFYRTFITHWVRDDPAGAVDWTYTKSYNSDDGTCETSEDEPALEEGGTEWYVDSESYDDAVTEAALQTEILAYLDNSDWSEWAPGIASATRLVGTPDFTVSRWEARMRLETMSGLGAEYDQTADAHYAIVTFNEAAEETSASETSLSLSIDQGETAGDWSTTLTQDVPSEGETISIGGPDIGESLFITHGGFATDASPRGGMLGKIGWLEFETASGAVPKFYRKITTDGERPACSPDAESDFAGEISVARDASADPVVDDSELPEDLELEWRESGGVMLNPDLPSRLTGCRLEFPEGPAAGARTPGDEAPRASWRALTDPDEEDLTARPRMPIVERAGQLLRRAQAFFCAADQETKTETLSAALSEEDTTENLAEILADLVAGDDLAGEFLKSAWGWIQDADHAHRLSLGPICAFEGVSAAGLAARRIPDLEELNLFQDQEVVFGSDNPNLTLPDGVTESGSEGVFAINSFRGHLPRRIACGPGGATDTVINDDYELTWTVVTVNFLTGAITTETVTADAESAAESQWLEAGTNELKFLADLKREYLRDTGAPRHTFPVAFATGFADLLSGNAER